MSIDIRSLLCIRYKIIFCHVILTLWLLLQLVTDCRYLSLCRHNLICQSHFCHASLTYFYLIIFITFNSLPIIYNYTIFFPIYAQSVPGKQIHTIMVSEDTILRMYVYPQVYSIFASFVQGKQLLNNDSTHIRFKTPIRLVYKNGTVTRMWLVSVRLVSPLIIGHCWATVD